MDLKQILQNPRVNLQNRASLRAVLQDVYPGEKRKINTLLDVYESGIAKAIKGVDVIDEKTIKRFLVQLENEYGLIEQYAYEAILIWADACDTKVIVNWKDIKGNLNLNMAYGIRENDSNAHKTEVVGNTTIPINKGVLSDYEINDLGNGRVEIKKYVGFEEEKMVIPNQIDGKKVVSIGEGAFQGCKGIKELIISEGIIIIEPGAFCNCSNLEKIHFPDTLIEIKGNEKYGAFEFCTEIEEIILPKKLKEIGTRTFQYCNQLEKVQFPDSLIGIGAYAFKSCSSIKHIEFPLSLKYIYKSAFEYCKLNTVILNKGIKELQADVFSFEQSQGVNTSIVIPNTVININENVFGHLLLHKPKVIYCYSGSKAMDFARKHGIKAEDARKII